ncbi:family 20 glycosylhydrolase [Phenylobacterium sp.]|uniref:family 20 glycosylhydrolase n=1 Tax=Phenylobacterium sp. TaxID=1871053 RepID=UPI0028125568|nr:family 20 glycosylhydrolase [Phenylobacterium sp.]
MPANARARFERLGAAVTAAAILACASPAAAAPGDVTPIPAEVTVHAGGFRVPETGAIAVPAGDAAARRTAEILADLTAKAGGPKLSVATAGRGVVMLKRERVKFSGDEAYALAVTPTGIEVRAPTDAGLFRGAMSAWQLLTEPRPPGAAAIIPAQTIDDAPRFGWRGLMLDSARHYQSPEFIKALIDAMAAHKLNVLHWHLTDDQAWRLEIRKYPKLTDVGAWRVPAGEGPARDIDPATGKPRLYGGFYTQAQAREIVAYAAARHVTVVPEIEMPGHASAAVAAYPQLAAAPNPPKDVPADWGVYPALFNVEEGTIRFLQDVLDEVIAVFPSTYIHVGGDEAVKDQWKASPQVQARMKALGIADEHHLQSWFIHRMEKHLSSRGRRLIGWDEILEGGLAPNATVMSWRGISGAVAAAKAGHDTVLSPAPTLYFDHRQSASPAEPPGRGKVISLKDVYAFDPTPSELTPEQQRHLLGLQANLWTEHVRTEARAAHMMFPRGLAVAELGWSRPERLGWEGFERRSKESVARLRAMGFPAAQSASDGVHTPRDPRRRDNRELAPCTDKIVLALEDDAPVRGERAVFLTDIMESCWTWKDAELTGIGAIRIRVGQLPFNFQIGEDIKKVTLRASKTPEGELEVRVGDCKAPPVAVIPLTEAAKNPAVTELRAALPGASGRRDLCFTVARPKVEPIWAIASVELEPAR